MMLFKPGDICMVPLNKTGWSFRCGENIRRMYGHDGGTTGMFIRPAIREDFIQDEGSQAVTDESVANYSIVLFDDECLYGIPTKHIEKVPV